MESLSSLICLVFYYSHHFSMLPIQQHNAIQMLKVWCKTSRAISFWRRSIKSESCWGRSRPTILQQSYLQESILIHQGKTLLEEQSSFGKGERITAVERFQVVFFFSEHGRAVHSLAVNHTFTFDLFCNSLLV